MKTMRRAAQKRAFALCSIVLQSSISAMMLQRGFVRRWIAMKRSMMSVVPRKAGAARLLAHQVIYIVSHTMMDIKSIASDLLVKTEMIAIRVAGHRRGVIPILHQRIGCLNLMHC
jgi:hypothetical protein